MSGMDSVRRLLNHIYGEETGAQAAERLSSIIKKYAARKRKKETYFSQEDVVLITYGDSLKRDGEAPLATLHAFANQYLKGAVSNIHFLPFFPYSSDDGFSVIDYRQINPRLGDWSDVRALAGDFGLALPVQIIVGRDYYVGAFSALRAGSSNMDVLVALGSTVAFVYSLATIFVELGESFFWELVTLIDVMLLGHWMEMRSVQSASKALEHLAAMVPTIAHRVGGDGTVSAGQGP